MAEIPTQSYQNLYFLSDEKIKDGDCCIRVNPNNTIVGNPIKADSTVVLSQSNKGFKKIIATTNKSLKLQSEVNNSDYKRIKSFIKTEANIPEPSPAFIQKFIKEYNKGNKIQWVMVDYEGDYDENYKALC